MSDICKTVLVKASNPKTQGDFVRINEDDFNPEVHEKLGGNPKTTEPTVSEAAKKLAEDAGIDIETITGTGANGNVTKGDVEAAIKAKEEE